MSKRAKRRDRARPSDERYADPTWYRILYALAIQELRAAEASGESGQATFATAEHQARELIERSSEVLDRIGWHYVARRPPWYRSWFKRFLAKLAHAWRRLRRKPPRRSFVGDWQLAEFLSDTVEPAAVVLLWSTRVGQGRPPKVPLQPPPKLPLKRRAGLTGESWLRSYLDELVRERPESEEGLSYYGRRLLGWVGFSKLRAAHRPSVRLQYNLACLFSRMAGGEHDSGSRDIHLATSARYLERCLSGAAGAIQAEARRRARSDPGLTALKTARRKWFEDLVGPETPPAEQAHAAAGPAVGATAPDE